MGGWGSEPGMGRRVTGEGGSQKSGREKQRLKKG